jgi:hypothetical protein
VQSDIGKKLLKLRVSFEEHASSNVKCGAYSVNFKLTGDNENHLIVLKGDKHINLTNKNWLSLHDLKQRKLRELFIKGSEGRKTPLYTIHTIEVEEWRSMSEEARINYLYDITKGQVKEKVTKNAARKIPGM